MSASILDDAERVVLSLWRAQQSLTRQAILWRADGSISMSAFTEIAERRDCIDELRAASLAIDSVRLFYFSESTAQSASGAPMDIILVEVADKREWLYGQRVYSAEIAPVRLLENRAPLHRSPFAGVFK